jgi:UDP:flavonoid glycosyltransferase YjiC (YdhE family)
MFFDVAPSAMLTDLVRLGRDWQSDLIVHEESESAGPIAGAILGIPSVCHGFGSPLAPMASLHMRGETVAPLWRSWGLEPAPFGGLFRYVYLDPCPPSLQAAHVAALGVVHPLRIEPFDQAGDEALPAWIESLPSQPIVYATLGTVPGYSQDLAVWKAICTALASEPLNLIITVGPLLDPATLGPLPANAHAERYIPQSLLFSRCDVVVTHGGAGTVLAALSHGIPLLMMPRGAPSQRANADACVTAGVARLLDDVHPDPDAIRREVRLQLGEPSHRLRAQQLRNEMDLMPGLEEGVTRLERLVAEQ